MGLRKLWLMVRCLYVSAPPFSEKERMRLKKLGVATRNDCKNMAASRAWREAEEASRVTRGKAMAARRVANAAAYEASLAESRASQAAERAARESERLACTGAAHHLQAPAEQQLAPAVGSEPAQPSCKAQQLLHSKFRSAATTDGQVWPNAFLALPVIQHTRTAMI